MQLFRKITEFLDPPPAHWSTPQFGQFANKRAPPTEIAVCRNSWRFKQIYVKLLYGSCDETDRFLSDHPKPANVNHLKTGQRE